MEPDNIIMGDATGIDLPQATPDENSLNEEKNMARYSKSKEFKKIRQHCEERIKFYQTYMPDGREIGLDFCPSPSDWRVANRVIGELKLLMNMYDTAKEIVEESVKNAR
jgi:hypothetical protein